MSCVKCFTLFLYVLMIVGGIIGMVVGILASIRTGIEGIGEILMNPVYIGFTIGFAMTTNIVDVLTIHFMSYVFIVIGVLGIFLGVWGTVAAIKRNKCMMVTASFLIFVLLAAQVVLTVFTGLGYAGNHLVKSNFDKLNGTEPFNMFQEDYKCCGIDGPGDYPTGMIPVPYCCVKYSNGGVNKGDCRNNVGNFTFSDGCNKYKGTIPLMAWVPVGILVIVCVASFFNFIFNIALTNNYRKEDY